MGYSTKSVLCQRAQVEFLSAGNVIYLQPDQDFSLVVWFKTSYTSGTQHLIARTYYSAGVNKGYDLSVLASGAVQFQMIHTNFTNHLSVVTTTTWADGDWHCAILTHDTALGGGTAAAVKLYIDGSLQTLTTNWDTLTSNLPEWSSGFTVGVSQADWNNTFDGYIDSVAIYRGKVLGSSEVGWIYNVGITQDLKHPNAPSGLTHWWRMGETITGDGEIADECLPEPYSPLTTSIDLNNDTVDEYVSFPAGETSPVGQGFTVGAWIKVLTPPSSGFYNVIHWPRQDLLADTDLNLAVYKFTGIGLQARYTGPYAGVGYQNQIMDGGGPGQWPQDIFDGEWHLVAMTWPGDPTHPRDYSTLLFHVDGQTGNYSGHGSGSPPPSTSLNSTIFVGALNGTSEDFVGQICHSFVYNRGMDASELTQLYNNGVPPDLLGAGMPTGLVHWSTLGDGCAPGVGNMPDLSGVSSDGTAHNVEGEPPGNPILDSPGGSYSTLSIQFLGGQYANLGNVLNFERTDAFSWSFWIKLTGDGEGEVISKNAGAPGNRGYEFYVNGRIYVTLYSDFSALNYLQVRTTNVELTTDVWAHVCITYDGSSAASGVTIYVDGASPALTTTRDTLSATIVHAGNLNFGRSATDAAYYLDADLDDMAVYDKELSGAEVTAIYNSGAPNDLSLLSSWADNVGWWKMGDGDSFPTLSDSGNGTSNDATYIVAGNDFVFDVPGAPGYQPLTQSIELNDGSSDEYVDFGLIPAADFLNTDACTFGVWIRHDQQDFVPSINEQQWLFAKHQTGGGDISFAVVMHVSQSAPLQPQYSLKGIYGSGIVKSNAQYSYAATRYPTWDGVWHLVIFRRASGGANAELWVDNVRYSESLGSWQPVPGMDADGTFTVGAYKSSGNPQGPVYGNVCHAFIYNKQLSFAEMKAIYAEGVPQDLSVVGPTANLVFWSGMGDGDAIGAGNVLDKSGGGHHGTLVNGEAGDFVAAVPAADYSLTLKGRIQEWPVGASVENEAPVGNEYSTYYEDPANIPLHTFQQDTFPQYEYDSLHEDPGNIPLYSWQATSEFEPTLWYRMRGIDTTCPAIQQPAYVFWTVPNTPDWNASKLTAGELICGTDPSTDVDDITIAGEWVEEPP